MKITKEEKDLFNQYFDEYCKNEYLKSEQDESVHINFSERFETNMEAVIKRRKRPLHYFFNTALKRVACVVTAFIIIACVISASVTANPKPYLKLVEDESKKFSLLYCDSEFLNTTIEEHYIPSYIPEGYELSEIIADDEQIFWIEYKNDKGGVITYRQIANFGNMRIDTEDAKVEFIDGAIYIEKTYIDNTLDKRYYISKFNYMLYISCENTCLTKEDVIKVMDSIVPQLIK